MHVRTLLDRECFLYCLLFETVEMCACSADSPSAAESKKQRENGPGWTSAGVLCPVMCCETCSPHQTKSQWFSVGSHIINKFQDFFMNNDITIAPVSVLNQFPII